MGHSATCRPGRALKPWIRKQLDQLSGSKLAVVLDPEELISARELGDWGEVIDAADWYTLRRAFERHGRQPEEKSSPLILHVCSDQFLEPRDLPYDIERSAKVVRVRVPVGSRFTQLVLETDDAVSDRAVRVLSRRAGLDVRSLVSDVWGVVLPDREDGREKQLEAAVQLRTRQDVPPSLWTLIEDSFTAELARALVTEPPAIEVVQAAWFDWLNKGGASQYDREFRSLGSAGAGLFLGGLLQPVPRTAGDLPPWTTVGALAVGPDERLRGLLEASPNVESDADAASWIGVAEWWGDTRATIAASDTIDGQLEESAWEAWEELDGRFSAWLRSGLGPLMTSSFHLPRTVDQIAPFLARRMREGKCERVMLVLLDGMAFAQWAQLRAMTPVQTEEPTGVFAAIPTLTPVSRQAVFAGKAPLFFPGTLSKTDTDESRWQSFWLGEGLSVTDARYKRVVTGEGLDLAEFDDANAVGIVVTAIDKMMHGADVLGDRQLSASVGVWARRGILEQIVADGVKTGFEVWVTSDHGNIEARGVGRIQEGLTVESAGTRVRWYASPALRAAGRAEGVVWDPPGLPEGVCYPLFAPGRTGYFTGDRRVSHGGTSIDEVIVPFVRVVA